MTYLTFLMFFLVPPVVILAAVLVFRGGAARPKHWLMPVMLVAGIALVYTSPWDNYLIYRGVWGYGTDRVMGTIGLVPVEEYGFMVLQSLLTGLWTAVVYASVPLPAAGSGLAGGRTGVIVFGLLSFAGLLMLVFGGESFVYLGLILVWCGPVLAGMWWLGGDRFSARRSRLVLAVMLPTVYLWNLDALAIHLGIWDISTDYTLQVLIGPLPVEEAVFFLVTNVLVVKGVLLIRPPINL